MVPRPSTAPSLGQSPSHKAVMWRQFSPAYSIDVLDTLDKMGTTEKLHNSHFYNLSVVATCKKHKALIENAASMIDTRLHPFVQSERNRLSLRKHLKAIDDLTDGYKVDIPNAIKHHSTFAQVRKWCICQA